MDKLRSLVTASRLVTVLELRFRLAVCVPKLSLSSAVLVIEKLLLVPVAPLTTMVKGLVASPVLSNWAVTPKLAPLIALTTPAGVAVVTLMVCVAPFPIFRLKSKGVPPLITVLLAAKAPLGLRCAVAIWVTLTLKLPAWAELSVVTPNAEDWLLVAVSEVKSLASFRLPKAFLMSVRE